MTEAQAYTRAGLIIGIAMGRTITGAGRGRKVTHKADEDPLAYWLGVEAIVDMWRDGRTAGERELAERADAP